MLLTMNDKPIKRIAVINDSAAARDEMAENLIEVGFQPVIQTSPLRSIEDCIETVTTQADAAILEHHFKSDHYANFMGAEAVAQLYRQHFPSLLVTAWADADIDNIRPFLRQIPVLIKSSEAYPEKMTQGFKQCINEFENRYSPTRQPWRTLVRIEDINKNNYKTMVYAVIPGWDPDDVVRFPLIIFPEELRQSVVPGARFFAKVNIAATHHDELYFEDFEVLEKPRGQYAKFLRS